MQALAVFPKKRSVELIEIMPPRLRRDDDVLVRIREVGICGTDREISRFHYGEPAPGSDRLVLGHEAIGEVVDLGPGVGSLARGDLVTLTVRRPCDEAGCIACRSGRQDFCTTGLFHERGIKQADGFLTELVVENERELVRVPRVLSDVGVLIEPLSIAAKASEQLDAIFQRFPWEPSELRGLVLGAGPIGLLAAMMLVTHGIDAYVFSRNPASERAAFVEAFGGTYISAEDTRLADLGKKVGAFDVVFEAVGVPKVAFTALEALAPNGVYIFSGVPSPSGPVETDLSRIMKNLVLENQLLFGTVNASRSAFEFSVRLLAQFMTLFPESVRGLVTERVPLADAKRTLEAGSHGIKQVVSLVA